MKSVLSTIVCTLLLLCANRAVIAAVPDALRIELRMLAQDVAKIIEKKGGGAIAIGEFSGSVEVLGHVGPGIQLTLTEELEAQQVRVLKTGHKYEISGRYQPFQDTVENRVKAGGNPSDATNLNAVKLVAFLIEKESGEPLAERPTGRLIFGSETVPTMLGLNTSNPPLRDPKALSDSFEQAQKQPQVLIKGSRVSGKSEKFAIEILVQKGAEYAPQPAVIEKETPFVKLSADDIYAVRLINNSPHEAAVDLKIDGINSFAFSDQQLQYWIIAPNSFTDIIGWHRNSETSTEFKVVASFPDTAAARLNLKPSANIGLITAAFSASWERDEDRPADEPELQGRGTGFGNDVNLKTEKVTRTIGQVRDVLSIRYERQ